MENSRIQIKQKFSYRLQQALRTYGVPFYLNNQFDFLELGKTLNLSHSLAKRYVKGLSLPPWPKLSEIAAALNVTPQWLMFGEHEPHPIANPPLKMSVEIIDTMFFTHQCLKNKPPTHDEFMAFKCLSLGQKLSTLEVSQAIKIGWMRQWIEFNLN
jgi:hypothetical protein